MSIDYSLTFFFLFQSIKVLVRTSFFFKNYNGFAFVEKLYLQGFFFSCYLDTLFQ